MSGRFCERSCMGHAQLQVCLRATSILNISTPVRTHVGDIALLLAVAALIP